MADINTKYIRKVIIESDNGKPMDEMDFTLDFFVYTNRLQTMKKSDLIRVVKDGKAEYYAVIDSLKLGRGNVKCRMKVTDVEPRISGMERPVVLVREVGITIGGCCCAPYSYHGCDNFEEGYKISFEAVTDIPKQDAQGVMYGIITDIIHSYGEITESMVYGLNTAISLDNVTLDVKQGDKIVVLVNADNPNHAYKGNGLGDLEPFSTSVLGSNGEYSLVVEGTAYRVYGEMALASGEMYIDLKV